MIFFFFFFSSRRRHTRLQGDWSSDVCSSDLCPVFLAILRMGTAPFSLLRMLADGRFHSGERLGRTLGLSRAGVWNLIRRIEALGLRVFKVRGRGYRLAEALDRSEEHTSELQSPCNL